MAGLPESDREAMGLRACRVASAWGPERFARGTIEALNRTIAAAEATAEVRERLIAVQGEIREILEAKLRESIRLAVRRRATAWTGKKPVVDVSIIRI